MKKILILVSIVVMSMGAAVASNCQLDKKPSEKIEKAKHEVVSTTFVVDIDCEACVKKVMSNIPYAKGVKDVKVFLEKKQVVVSFDPNKTNNEQIIKSFKKIKKTAKVLK